MQSGLRQRASVTPVSAHAMICHPDVQDSSGSWRAQIRSFNSAIAGGHWGLGQKGNAARLSALEVSRPPHADCHRHPKKLGGWAQTKGARPCSPSRCRAESAESLQSLLPLRFREDVPRLPTPGGDESSGPPGARAATQRERERENERKSGSIERERESASFCVFVFQRRRLSDLGPRPRRGPRRDFIPSLTFKKPLRFPRFPQHCWQVARTMRKAVEDCNCESTCAQSSTVESGVSRASTRLRQASQRALSHRCTRRCGPRKKILKF